jgi:hypothetical protein
MNDIERYEPNQIPATDPTGGRLIAWAQAASAAHKLAQALSKTSFVPKDFQGREYDATAAIIMGDELGLSPLAALRSIYVVHGQPSMYARTMVALTLSHGHQIWTVQSDETKVTVAGQRRGSDRTETSTWSIARAQKAGYTSNTKYKSNPQEMLWAKAAAEVARKVAADVLAGVPMSVEDLELEEPAPTSPIKRNGKTSIKRADPTPPPVAPEPEFEPPPSEETPRTASDAQVKKIQILYRELGVADRDERLADTSAVIGRDITTTAQLTIDEASRLIDTLENMKAGKANAEPLL